MDNPELSTTPIENGYRNSTVAGRRVHNVLGISPDHRVEQHEEQANPGKCTNRLRDRDRMPPVKWRFYSVTCS